MAKPEKKLQQLKTLLLEVGDLNHINALLGWPILGDPVYGKGAAEKLHLLARAIRLDLDPLVIAEAPPPEHMLTALRRCGFRVGRQPDVQPAGR